MARFLQTAFLYIVWLSCGFLALAEQSQVNPAHVDTGTPLRLGSSTIALSGPWKFQIGDSPIDPLTHEWLWAKPEFDDSHWETVDLTPAASEADASFTDQHQVKGWTARGHAGYWGWAWYRLRITVAPVTGEQIAIDGPASTRIEGPTSAEDAWQFFADGKLLGSFGEFDSRGGVRRIYSSRPLMFRLPTAKAAENGEVTTTLAFRVWMGPGNLVNPDAGGLRDAPLLLAASTAQAQSRLDWQEALISRADEAAYIALFLLLAVLAASLTLFDPADRVYLWLAATMLVAPIGYIVVDLCAVTTWLDSRVADIIASINDALWAAGWMMVWWVWFRLRRPAWVPKAVAILMVFFALADALTVGLIDSGLALPHGHNSALLAALGTASLTFRLIFVAAIAWVVGMGIRREGKEGWFALPAVAALAVEMLGEVFGVTVVGRFHDIKLRLWDITDPVLVAVLVFLMLRRLLHSLKRQRQMALDVKQAQEVQQVILPELRTVLPGFTIESEYRPAREVGGDFFQVVPHPSNGSLLIVAGDVTGKGLQAGMLVALLVGAIRGTVELNPDPLSILYALNRLLRGRGEAHATCLALSIDSRGLVTLANAGHIAPYLNGEPVAMEGALPLGMIDRPEFSVMHFALQPGDKLVLLSDGIAEATNAEGRLFGFERIGQLLRTAHSAAEVAAAAQVFGQEDDISVVIVTRTDSAESSVLPEATAAAEPALPLSTRAAQLGG